VSLLVITGPPGAGKSTVAEALADSFEPSVLVAGDEFFGFLRRGAIEPWLPESEHQNTVATTAAAFAAGAFADGGYITIFDGILGPWFLETFARATGLPSLDYAVLLPSKDRCVARVATRQEHGFTDEPATRHMHEQFATRFGDLDRKHLIIDPPDVVEETVDLVINGMRSGQFAYRV
jgi:predicted ABC-type ATPase